MIVGITGTRNGMTPKQKQALNFLLKNYFAVNGSPILHHGDCIGADEECATVAKSMGYKIICHPPTDSRYRAFFSSDEYFSSSDYISRNHEIVDSCEILLAFPKSFKEEFRGSGSWATIRYAKKTNKRWLIVLPDGTLDC